MQSPTRRYNTMYLATILLIFSKNLLMKKVSFLAQIFSPIKMPFLHNNSLIFYFKIWSVSHRNSIFQFRKILILRVLLLFYFSPFTLFFDVPCVDIYNQFSHIWFFYSKQILNFHFTKTTISSPLNTGYWIH